MLTAVALVSLLGWAVLLAAILGHLVDRLDRRRLDRVVAEIKVTEAVHGVLGAIVAPTVARHRGQPWTVTIGLAPAKPRHRRSPDGDRTAGTGAKGYGGADCLRPAVGKIDRTSCAMAPGGGQLVDRDSSVLRGRGR